MINKFNFKNKSLFTSTKVVQLIEINSFQLILVVWGKLDVLQEIVSDS